MNAKHLAPILLVMLAPLATPQQQQPPPRAAQGAEFPMEQLEQLVAPIALYPDGLLAQVLMAATYPLEIVEAARWQAKNPKVKGDKLEAALTKENWDPSVKSLCGFPDVLKRMNDNLDWTQDLGDAFLGQQAEVMNAVQNMRRKALEAGTLKSGKELTVTEQADKIIVIETAEPEVIYVPTYYPSAVYGSWHYPYWYYPPMYPPPPTGGVWFGFTAGVIWGAAIWGDCDWGHTEIDIDVDHYHEFVDRTESGERRQQAKDRVGTDRNWKHSAEHRGGVSYRDKQVAQRYGAGPGQTRVTRDQARGYGDRGARPASGDVVGAGAGTRDRSAAAVGARERQAVTASRDLSNISGQRSGSFSGSRSPSLDRASSMRGASSRGMGGMRGGGGRR
jgi:hypothetical protein